MAGLFDFIFGGGDETKKLDAMSPEQQQFLQQIMQMLGPEGQLGQGNEQAMQQLMELLDPSSEAQQRFADPYMQQFQQQTVPGLAEQFAGAGGSATGGALSSSGFGQAIGGAGANLQSQLAELKSKLQMGAGKDLMSQFSTMSGQGLGAKPFGYQQIEGSPGLVPSALTAYAGKGFPGLGTALSKFGSRFKGFGG